MYLPSIIQTLLECGVNVAVAGADPFSEREGALRAILKKYKGRIQIFGVLSEHQKAELLRQTDVVLVPSIFESFGLIAGEALMSGAGVCAYSGSGVEEILTGAPNVVIVEKNSTIGFARAAADLSQTIFTDPEIKSLGKRFAEKNFSSDYIAQKLTAYLS
jgi:glycosyltransferase involved in cell wall biosynthesis